jgi:hypothetical protein
LPSKIIRRGSLKPTAVGKLEEFLAQSLLVDAETEADPEKPFVVVCHAPLVAAFNNYESPNDVEYGRVYETPTELVNPKYNPRHSEIILSGRLEAR